MTVRIGISGWSYPGWRGDFYPQGLPHRLELEYAAERMDALEVNASFYSLQRPDTYRAWAARTPDDTVFAVKGSRYITHLKRLRDVDAPLANFFASGVLLLGPKLGPFLWQLPERVAYQHDVLDDFLGRLPTDTMAAAALAGRHDARVDGRCWYDVTGRRALRHVLEVRNATFDDPDALGVLRHHNVGLVVADTAGRWPMLWHVTADVVYVRLHGDTVLYASGYPDEALDHWAALVRGWDKEGLDVFVFFDNDILGYAPYDAMRLIDRVRTA